MFIIAGCVLIGVFVHGKTGCLVSLFYFGDTLWLLFDCNTWGMYWYYNANLIDYSWVM